MDPFLTSAAVVAVAEIGDKTQLLALLLTARFRKPLPVLLGILAATLLNHALAALAGYSVAAWLKGPWFQWIVGVAFLLMAAWALVPDKADEGENLNPARGGVFLATLIAFFLVEIGDKTQIATSLLAARFHEVLIITAGTTLGMMAANTPVVFLGEAAVRFVPLKYVRMAAAGVFLLIGAGVIAAAVWR